MCAIVVITAQFNRSLTIHSGGECMKSAQTDALYFGVLSYPLAKCSRLIIFFDPVNLFQPVDIESCGAIRASMGGQIFFPVL